MLSWRRSTRPAPGLLYAGYIGGAGDEWGYGIAVDGVGNAYVTGCDPIRPEPPSP